MRCVHKRKGGRMDRIRRGLLLAAVVVSVCFFPFSRVCASDDVSLNNESSVALVAKAWKALEDEDIEAVMNLTEKCLTRYGKRPKIMQATLSDYVAEPKTKIQSYWALNDVATALFIQGKALQNIKEYDKAKAVYQKIVDEYTFGQCWDPRGWFWKPAEVAGENLEMIETGVFYDFGDYTSSAITTKAWESLDAEEFDLAHGYANKCIDLYQAKAREMQKSLEKYPEGSDEELFKYWALNDVATAHFIKARAYVMQGKDKEAAKEFKMIRDDFSFGQCWDPRGWWWKVADQANNWFDSLEKKD